MAAAGMLVSTKFFLVFHHVVWTGDQVVHSRSAYSCSVYDLMQLLYDSDGYLPLCVNEANDLWLDLAWKAQEFASRLKAMNATVRILYLNIWVLFYMNHTVWWLSSPNFTLYTPVLVSYTGCLWDWLYVTDLDPLSCVTTAYWAKPHSANFLWEE